MGRAASTVRVPRPRAPSVRLRRAAVRPLAALGLLLGGAACAGLPADPVAQRPLGELDEAGAARQLLVTLEQRGSWRVPRAGTTPHGYDRDYGTSARTRRAARRLAAEYGLREVSAWPIDVLGVHCVVFAVPASASPAELLQRLRADRRVESVQPMQLFEAQAEDTADPYLGLQHGIEATQVTEAHRWALGTGVRVAIIDTGVDLEHPDLAGHAGLARDFVDDGPPARWKDRHGTAVAGVIASTAGNGLGIVGVAPRVELMPLKACWPEAPGSAAARCNSFTLAKALAFAVERRAQVINLSLAGPPDPLLERLVRAALDRGTIVVAARDDSRGPSFPCDVEGVLAVRSPGPPGEGSSGLRADLAAPGVDVLTTVPGGAFDFVSGSSLAAAHVSGIVALLLEKDPGLSAERIAGALAATSRAAEQPGVGPAELVNACAALASVLPGVDCAGRPPRAAAPTGAG